MGRSIRSLPLLVVLLTPAATLTCKLDEEATVHAPTDDVAAAQDKSDEDAINDDAQPNWPWVHRALLGLSCIVSLFSAGTLLYVFRRYGTGWLQASRR